MYEIKPLTKADINDYKNLCRTFINYKRKTLKNQDEKPLGKKVFRELFYSIISKASNDFASENPNHFFVMQNEDKIIGFASISTRSDDVVDIPYTYGEVKDFYIAPKLRRKGYGRILNEYIENIFKQNKTKVVLLSPDPVGGIDFWKAMGYRDTGIHQGWGRHLVYIKHIIRNESSLEIDNAISKLVTLTDLIGINPYNKPQMKEAFGVWEEYCREVNRKPNKKDVTKMTWSARKNRNISFKALYYKGKIIGFTYKADAEINYVSHKYKNII